MQSNFALSKPSRCKEGHRAWVFEHHESSELCAQLESELHQPCAFSLICGNTSRRDYETIIDSTSLIFIVILEKDRLLW